MKMLRYIHWDEEEAGTKAAEIERHGIPVDWRPVTGNSFLRELSKSPPMAVVIDLSRLPSQGRDLAIQIRRRKSTRDLPLVFLGGEPEKVNRIQEILPDAIFATWEQHQKAIVAAQEPRLDAPVVPDSAFAGYAGKSLPQKLGLHQAGRVALVGEPEGFPSVLEALPTGGYFANQFSADCDLTLWFVSSRVDLEAGLASLQQIALLGPIWIAWPKKVSGVESDLSQQVVRQLAMESGFVDYKICSIDSTWSGLLFKQRTATKSGD